MVDGIVDGAMLGIVVGAMVIVAVLIQWLGFVVLAITCRSQE